MTAGSPAGAPLPMPPTPLAPSRFPRDASVPGHPSTTRRAGPSAKTPVARDPILDLPEDRRAAFVSLRDEALACVRCRLHKTRAQVVFGVGTPCAPLMFVGEAPGADEDKQGEPFVGRAGQLFTRVLAELGARRDQVYIANVIKCRPPENRKPEADETSQCFPYLRRQIEIIRPRVLCALGAVAAQTLLGSPDPISKIRGRFYDFAWVRGIRLFPTFHPAYLLRSPWEQPKFKQDLRQILTEVRLAP